jgi:beta-galactosidase
MKQLILLFWSAVVLSTASATAANDSSTGARTTTLFDADWRFVNADPTNAEQVQFDDSAWRRLDVPHDWSIEGPFSETNLTSGSDAFLPAGVGWYRKHFSLTETNPARNFFIEFDGVMANSDVWVNGFHLGHRPYGYVGLNYELTGHLNFGGDNVIAVRADNSVQPASRFYCGAGIYRHVRLVASGAVHFENNGIFLATPEVSATEATVKVDAAVTNESGADRKISFQTQLISPDGKVVASIQTDGEAPASTSQQFSPQIVIPNPQLWNLDSPNLYRVVSTIVSDGKILDMQTNSFGIREFHFDADTGFWLNGKNFKIKGICLHEDGGAFGMAVPLSVYESRLKMLKSLGVNAIRTAHNPPAPEFLDLCDRMGFLVMDEMFDCWTVGKPGLDGQKLADYHLYFNDWSKIDTADTVRRDRNHPSIILYSAGNEIHDTPNAELAKGILAGLIEVFHTNDPTRPVTQALFRPNSSHDYEDGLADMLDVVGQNYHESEILAAHDQKPARKIIGTENHGDRATWLALRDHAPYAGQFIWTGVDYLGESRAWPAVASGAGFLDRTGRIKPSGYERQSWWSDAPMVKIARRVTRGEVQTRVQNRPQLLSDWTPENSAPHDENVETYSNCKEVELFLNGKSLGIKEINPDASPRTWTVPFEPGILKADARNGNGRTVATDELQTAGKPAKILLTTGHEKPHPRFLKLLVQKITNILPGTGREKIADDWDGVCEVTATIADARGVPVPGADNLITFNLSGAGVIAAVDSADNSSHEPFQATERHTFQGRCVAFVKATAPDGNISLTAAAPGLKSATIALAAAGAK